jgi:hypothetical protein
MEEVFVRIRFRSKLEIIDAVIVPAPEKDPPPKEKGNGAAHPKRKGSRIDMTIVQALCSGAKTRAQLRFALRDGGLSPASLPHGLHSLKRQGTIKRVGPAVWALAATA